MKRHTAELNIVIFVLPSQFAKLTIAFLTLFIRWHNKNVTVKDYKVAANLWTKLTWATGSKPYPPSPFIRATITQVLKLTLILLSCRRAKAESTSVAVTYNTTQRSKQARLKQKKQVKKIN